MIDFDEVLKFIKTYWSSAGVIWWMGGASHYLYQVSQGRKFNLIMFFINVLLAGWLTNTLAPFIPLDINWRDGIIWMVGFSAYPILRLIETNSVDIFKWFINKK